MVLKNRETHETVEKHSKKILGVNTKDAKLSLAFLTVSFISLLIGGVLGLLQGLERSGLLQLPSWLNYYQVLTAHGILLLIVFTATFSIGYLYAGFSHTLGGLLAKVRKMAWVGFVLMVIGVVLVVTTIVMGDASVMYTFYPPLAAAPMFYIGLVFIVLGIWACCFGVFVNYRHWRKTHRGQVTPLFAFFTMGVFVLWFFGSISVTVEVFMLIAWSLGWIETINVMLSRTLFWSFGHTLVNIWYIVAISAWYVVIPKIIGGRLFSDKLARVVVIALVILNIPGGFHHTIVDPGITQNVKFLHLIMSISIGIPSLMTAFAMFAVFERTGRKLGGKGLFGWIKKLPWKDVRFLAPMIAMISFIPGGAGGIVNTSNQLNQVIHNTMWVVGHFHITVGTSVVLTFFGICYWLIPYLSKREFTPQMNKLGLIQTYIWTIGMILMAGSMHLVGLLGDPRRTSNTTYGDHEVALSWVPYEYVFAIGGTLLMIGVIIQVYAVFHMMFLSPKGYTEFPIAEPEDDALLTPLWTERWGLWIVLLLLVVVMAYAPIMSLIYNAPPGSPPFKTW
ncbi:cbb3-type cytochrome c oxidase subunit I [Paenisporosarcina antarctica]|uniref:Cytochrome C n=1 Tax=Paenisporosarcina antarctica TaxID=417367 RepID=A0A4P7A1X1_9BACL|nr:cbb3-type cytochrome c oxidase subunit I [Paenisporosarcina antarctica]QBP42604.1 cytochrome C [Paenisporosarcina antarctica]